jgi:hypothetical protein
MGASTIPPVVAMSMNASPSGCDTTTVAAANSGGTE